MQLQAGVAAAVLALLSTASAAPAKCKWDPIQGEKYEASLKAAGIEVVGDLKPTQKPKEKLRFLDLAETAAFEGVVIVMFVIAPDGTLADRVVLCSDPFGYFEPGVLDWAKDYRFPPLAAGAPEHYRASSLSVHFRLR